MPDKLHHNICVEIVRILHSERERQGLSKYIMAQRSGLSEQMIGYVERGLRRPSLETALRLADALKINLGDVIKKAYKAVAPPKSSPRSQ